MKVILYIRRVAHHPNEATMKVRLEPEPCYDSPRVSNFANEIEASLNNIIANCESAGYITANQKIKTRKVK